MQIDSGNQLASFAGHQDRVTSLQFSTSGDRLWSLTASGKRTGYDLQTRQEIESDQLRVVDVSTSTISSAGMIAAIADGAPERICIFDPRSSPDERELPGHTYEVLGLAFSRQGDILASVGRDRYVRLREVPVGDARLLRGHAHWSTCVAISPDGKTLATGSRGGEAILWSLPTGRPLMRLPTHGHGIARIAFAPDGRRLAFADIQANVWIWEVFLTENDPWSVLGAGQ